MWVVDRVHRHTAIVRHAPEPTFAPGLADRDVHVIRVRHRTDAGHAAAMHEALLGGIQAQNHVFPIAANDLRIGAGRTCDLAALADFDLHVVDDGTDGDIADRHGIARLD